MKLLSKSEISKAAAVDRQREIEEGLKLAKRVDSLREVAAEEDASLEKFRTETLARISKEISEETTKRDVLVVEVVDLEERKRLSLIPITEKWDEVLQKESLVAEQLAEVDKQKQSVANTQSIAEATYADASQQKNRADDMYIRAEKALLEAHNALQTAENDRVSASNTLFDAKGKVDLMLKAATEKESWVTEREKSVLAKEKDLKKRELELAKQFSLLKDREATLERNIKRNK